MSARALWIVALGAALAVLIAINVFRPEEPGSADADIAPRPSSAGDGERRDEGLAAEHPAEVVRGAPSPARGANATAADGRAPPSESQLAPVSLPNPGPFASISAALEEHDVSPERRIRPPPEMLATERAFAAESVDPGWSTAAEASVLARFAEIPGLSLVSLNVECRKTLCLLQFVTPQAPAPDYPNPNIAEIARSVGLKSLWMMGIRVGGAPVSLAYLERAGSAEASAGAADQ